MGELGRGKLTEESVREMKGAWRVFISQCGNV